jgi:hypothetical protein
LLGGVGGGGSIAGVVAMCVCLPAVAVTGLSRYF